MGRSTAVVFPGQASQFVGMADPWLSHRIGRAALEEASEALGRDLAVGCRDETLLATTEFLQPALLACEVAAFRVLQAEGSEDWAGAAGHSVGEFAALVATGVCSLRDAIGIVAVRGGAMQRASHERPGTMTALLGIGAEEAAAVCDEARHDDVLVVANENSPQQVVISGSVSAIERAEDLCASRKIRTVRLQVTGAFHSPLMAQAVAPLSEAIGAIEFRPPKMPVASNVTGELIADPEDLRSLVTRQVVSPVRWEQCVRTLAAAGAETFVEAGPGEVLSRLAKRIVPGATAFALGSPEAVAARSGVV